MTKKKPRKPLTRERLVGLLAELAHRHGLWARDLPDLPSVWRDVKGLTPEQMTPSVLHEADALNAQRTREMVDRMNRDGGPPVVLVPPHESLSLTAQRCRIILGRDVGLVPFLRWAGSEGWNPRHALAVLDFAGLPTQPWLVEQQLEYGAQGHGVPALDEDQQLEFVEMLGLARQAAREKKSTNSVRATDTGR